MKVKAPFQSLEGKILVASPHINDQNFDQALIYVCMHDENGAVGVIINQRIGKIAEVDLNNYIKDFKNIIIQKSKSNKITEKMGDAKSKSAKHYPVLFGGPVYSDRIVILSLTKEQEKSFAEQQNLTLYTDMVTFVKEYAGGKNYKKILFAKGIAAWSPSQLEEEISESNWFVVPASLDLLFSQRAKSKWESIIKELGINNYSNLVNYSGQA